MDSTECLLLRNGATYSDEEEVHNAIVHLPKLEHSLRADSTPDNGGVVDNLCTVAGEALCILGATQVRDMADHPSNNYE